MILDISGENYNRIGFGESYSFMSFPTYLDTIFSLRIWGLDITIQNEKPEVWHNNDTGKEYYISGFSTLTFEEAEHVSLEISLYGSKNSAGYTNFIKDENGKVVKLNKLWNKEPENPRGNTYFVGGIIDWPYGGYEMKVISSGKVTLNFNIEECIPIHDFSLHPEKYAYQRK